MRLILSLVAMLAAASAAAQSPCWDDGRIDGALTASDGNETRSDPWTAQRLT